MSSNSQSPAARKEAFSIQIVQIMDAVLVWLSFILATRFRDHIVEIIEPLLALVDVIPPETVPPLSAISSILMIIVPTTPLILETFGFYRVTPTKSRRRAFSEIFKSFLVVTLVIALLVIFFKVPANSRIVLASALTLGGGFLLLRDWLICLWLRRRILQDDRKERVLLAGLEGDLDAFWESLPEETKMFWNVVDRFDLKSRDVSELDGLITKHSVSRVVFAAMDVEFQKVAQAAEVCELQGVEAWIRASFARANVARPEVDMLGGQPMLVLRSTPELSWALLAKDLMDRLGSLILIILTAVLWVPAVIGIMVTSPGASPFFRQKRAGKHGQAFNMWKLRTMVPDAPALLEKLKQEQGNEMDGPVFKLENDPRIFPLGRLLRKLSIDELPQLFNVLLGDMSLVGPRPLPVYEVEKFEHSRHRRRLSMKPGITCIWQAGGRNKISSFEEWVRMDLEYIDNWSLWLDIKLLFKTVPAVVFAKGAK